MRPFDILQLIRKETPKIILFNSLAGKDSIMLLDMCSQMFEHVYCVYMYYVPDLEHMNRFKRFFDKQYQNVTWSQTEHFATNSYKKYGLYGYPAEPKLKKLNLAMITNNFRKQLNLEWVIFRSKQSDGLSRRLQLKTYDFEAIDWNKKKAYPLSKFTNKEVLQYIKVNNCIEPLNYGDKRPSQSNDITDGVFLSWCKKNFPDDLQKIFNLFPECELILFRHENQTI
jgi:sulfate adenylyltransferase subunit 2